MPRVKIDHIVSFSSEDPEAPASNLLAAEVSKKKWLCAKGETSCSVVLQLVKAVKIVCVQIGVEHAALVEVLVGRSENPNQQYEVLVPSCVFVNVAESRRDVPVQRVRSFSGEQLASAASQQWDRVRVVCSQPYNKHCKYGISFIHIFDDSEDNLPPVPTVTSTTEAVSVKQIAPLGLDIYSSDEDEFTPGELFAKSKEVKSKDTGAQIRQATSQILRNVADAASSSLVKTMTRNDAQKPKDSNSSSNPDTKRKPDKDRRKTMQDLNKDKPKEKDRRKTFDEFKEDKKNSDKDKESKKDDRHSSKERKRDRVDVERHTSTHKDNERKQDKAATTSFNKRSSERDEQRAECSRKRSKPQDGNTVLSEVVFAMSGYENPRRARVRDTALAMGAKYRPDWGADCTHLICAFPNTPKLRKVRSSVGDKCIAVTAEWIEECALSCAKLPWQWFATEPSKKEKRPQEDKTRTNRVPTPSSDDGCDTDDEIEKVLHNQKRARLDSSPSTSVDVNHSPRDGADSEKKKTFSDMKKHLEDDDDSPTDTESTIMEMRPESLSGDGVLPEIFSRLTFAIDDSVRAAGMDCDLLERYVRAYGGELVSQDWQTDSPSEDRGADYTLAAGGGVGRRVRADWVWSCHTQRALLSPTPYMLSST